MSLGLKERGDAGIDFPEKVLFVLDDEEYECTKQEGGVGNTLK